MTLALPVRSGHLDQPALGLLTPPVGIGLYIASAMSGVKPVAIFRALWPFLLATLVC